MQGMIFVASQKDNDGGGIYMTRMDARSGALDPPRKVAQVLGASFLAPHPSRPYLYAVGRTTAPVPGEGFAYAFRIDASGTLGLLNRQSTIDPGPAHIAIEPGGRMALVANYRNGSAIAFPIEGDGSLSPSSWFARHEGKGPVEQRQESAHAHSTTIDPAGKVAIVADLGIDKLMLYDIDAAALTLRPHAPPSASVPPGAGPRHARFHAGGRFLYVLNELDSTVTVFSYEAATGTLAELQTISNLPPGFAPDHTKNIAAEVSVHPDGRMLYASNRGHDSIAVFSIDASSGKLTPVQHAPAGGRTPRHFAIDPSGRFLISALLDSHRLVVFEIDRQSGRLTQTDHFVEMPSPICVLFARE
jgi:6-phosphogluconolactonase